MQGTEPWTRAPWLRPSDDEEVVGRECADLQPVLGAPGAVGRIGLLRNYALESHRTDLLVHFRAPLLDVIREPDWPDAGEDLPQKLLTPDEGQSPQVIVAEAEEVEGVEGRGQLESGAGDFRATPKQPPSLEPAEAGQPPVVVHDHLAIEYQPLVGKSPYGTRYIGKGFREVSPRSGDEDRVTSLTTRDQPVSIVLDLEEPAGLRERLVPGGGQHDLDLTSVHAPLFRAELREPPGHLIG